eukprot:TRINITY_DN83181_c0_g1_i1.p1 TRINITY_DN83181_c0_g1~~TRINITY_DN83181_c0_g1_i1.p1  ORF type:complete len:430 (-),score=119.44 TRINITY_DN83181_c0_g1_i1:73-1362(-)
MAGSDGSSSLCVVDPAGWATAKAWAQILGALAFAALAVLLAFLEKIGCDNAYVISSIPLFLAVGLWLSRWKVSRPDEWLLILRDGQLIGQGVGLRAFCGWRDTVAKFPAAIQKVRFKATQVDLDMQGMEVSGYLSWSVNREGEGPWNAYKYLAMRDVDGDGKIDSDAGSQHVAEMAKAVLRSRIANSTLKDVLTQRETLRDKVKQSMMEQVKGWGVWVEAVEISDVRICSDSLFKDLQATHRQKVHLQAEEARLQTERKIQEMAMKDELCISKAKAEAEAEKRLNAAQQRLRAEQEEAELFARQAEAAKARLRMEEEIELARITKDAKLQKAAAEAQAAVARVAQQAELERLNALYEAESKMPESTLKRMAMETTKDVFQKLPLRDVRLNVFGGDGCTTGGLASAAQALGLANTWEMLKDSKHQVNDNQ